MTKLTGAALDRAVANAMGLKSVHNCEKWVGLTTNELLECAKDFDGKLPQGWAKIVYLAQDILKEKNT